MWGPRTTNCQANWTPWDLSSFHPKCGVRLPSHLWHQQVGLNTRNILQAIALAIYNVARTRCCDTRMLCKHTAISRPEESFIVTGGCMVGRHTRLGTGLLLQSATSLRKGVLKPGAATRIQYVKVVYPPLRTQPPTFRQGLHYVDAHSPKWKVRHSLIHSQLYSVGRRWHHKRPSTSPAVMPAIDAGATSSAASATR
jgi:hypothetical protein